MKSEGSTMLAAAVAFLAVTGGGDAHLNEPVYAPGVPPPKVNDGKLDKSDKSCIHSVYYFNVLRSWKDLGLSLSKKIPGAISYSWCTIWAKIGMLCNFA